VLIPLGPAPPFFKIKESAVKKNLLKEIFSWIEKSSEQELLDRRKEVIDGLSSEILSSDYRVVILLIDEEMATRICLGKETG
jgi:hypothetical protein